MAKSQIDYCLLVPATRYEIDYVRSNDQYKLFFEGFEICEVLFSSEGFLVGDEVFLAYEVDGSLAVAAGHLSGHRFLP